MATIHRSALVPYSAEQMFQLVHDVDQYKLFLPWCSDSGIIEDVGDLRKAYVAISRGGVSKSFTTLNRVLPDRTLEIELVEGPFQHLEGHWRFLALEASASKVSLDLEFEFSSTLVKMAFGRLFEQLANRLVDSFVVRAGQVYGQG